MPEQQKQVDPKRAQMVAKGLYRQGNQGAAEVLNELAIGYLQLLELAKAQREWIDAVPEGTELPTMPGHDRDWADSVLAGYLQPKEQK